MTKKHKTKDTTIALNRRILGANAKYREAVSIINELQLELAHRSSMEKVSKIVLPHKYKICKSTNKESTVVVLASDWHVDEIIDIEAMNGLNEFNQTIAKQRAEVFFTHTLKLINLLENASQVKTVVFAALGDFISGWIHPALIEASLLTPPEALMCAYELLLGGLKFLLEKGNFEQLIFVSCVGNHGRITAKPRDKGLVKKSYEWLLYEFLARKFANTKAAERIKFVLPKGYFNWLNIYDYNLRFHHGDGIQYRGGVGGIHIPLKKAIAQWDKARVAEIDVMGHWHTRENSDDYVINGSLCGYNEYAIRIKADYRRPAQSLFELHPKYGKTAEFPIILE